ncbi:MAG: thioredoxin [Lachnospiraceae bacterium]|nr:thioredoxin [Lachnospiraceae bacterium]
MLNIENQEQFEKDVLQAKKPVLVDFYADWCGPCKAIAPLLEELDQEAEAYCIGKVNVDALPDLAMQYRVVSIPALLVFKDGECINRGFGLMNRKEVEGLLA